MEREGVERVKMFVVIVIAYLVFWGPLFLVTLARPGGESYLLFFCHPCVACLYFIFIQK